MRFFSELKRIFKCDEFIPIERLNSAEASFSITFANIPSEKDLKNLCSIIPGRDFLKITFVTESDQIAVVTNNNFDYTEISRITECLLPEDNIDIEIQIDKTIYSNRFSIYDFPSFSNDLLNRSLLDIMRWFSESLKLQNFLIFEVYDYDISFSSRTIAFESGDGASFTPKIDRIFRLDNCKKIACFYNMDKFELIPDDFIVEGIIRTDSCLKKLFGKLATILSMCYTSTSASLHEDLLSVHISGQRIINSEININDIEENEKWITIYSWLYTDGNAADKALIIHNIICLYCKYDGFLNLDKTVFEAIRSNYELYLRNNVTQYLDLKRDISTFIQNIVSKVGDYALDILSKFKSNLIAIFVFLFTVVLTNIGKTKNWGDIFTRDTNYLIEIFLIGSLFYLVIVILETKYKIKKAKQGYDDLKQNYFDVLSYAELNEAFNEDNLWKKTEKTLKKGMIIWSILWGGVLIAAILVIEILTADHGVAVWAWGKIF